jgi:hypothetical protein
VTRGDDEEDALVARTDDRGWRGVTTGIAIIVGVGVVALAAWVIDQRHARRRAHEAAVKRTLDAHPEEFAALLEVETRRIEEAGRE